MIYFDHIIWQPTFTCNSMCKKCYIATYKHAKTPYMGPEILNLIKDNKVQCEQFTLSLDDTHQLNKELVRDLDRPWGAFGIPKLCVTANNWSNIKTWASQLLKGDLKGFLQPLHTLSLSSLPRLGKDCEEPVELCEQTDTVLNYNKVATKKLIGSKSFEIGCRYSDMVHLVLEKSPLGEDLKEGALDAWFDVKDEVPPEKLQQDACLQWAQKRINGSQNTCSAGVNLVHIWPDQTVTGCPYDSKHIATVGTDSLLGILAYTKDTSCMLHCHIPEALREYQLSY